jgi:hypothetical protein
MLTLIRARLVTIGAYLAIALGSMLLALEGARAEAPGELGAPYTSVNNNLHQIDGPDADPGGERAFRLYRSGAPSREAFGKWCSEFGIERVIVMDGSAHAHELKYQTENICPEIQVIYNVNQGLTPVSDGFLRWFDDQVAAARRDRAGLLIRCKTGSHRTGRVAAYYQMKYQGVSLDRALAIMDHKGKMMELFNIAMAPQVRAMDDYIRGRPCGEPGSCVLMNSNLWVP